MLITGVVGIFTSIIARRVPIPPTGFFFAHGTAISFWCMYYVRRDTASVDTHQSGSRMVMHLMVQPDLIPQTLAC